MNRPVARLFGLALEAQTIDALGRRLEKLLNSRIGLALLIWGSFQLSLAPRLEDIQKNTSRIALQTRDFQLASDQNHDLLVRLLGSCTRPDLFRNEPASPQNESVSQETSQTQSPKPPMIHPFQRQRWK